MRLQYLAKEERDVIGRDREELMSVQRQLAQLAQMTKDATTPQTQTQTQHMYPQQRKAELREHISRVSFERQTLINAGLYTPSDAVIVKLDADIAQYMQQLEQM